jgi:hypothetical protein
MNRISLAAATFALLAALAGCRGKTAAPQEEAQRTGPGSPDRGELVLQPSSPWVPPDVPRKLGIQLISEKDREMTGGKFRYRLEVRNVGRDDVAFKEGAPSFIKDGSLCGPTGFRFMMIAADGKETRLACDSGAPAEPGSSLDLALKPGEYLLTRPARSFRDLRTSFLFDQPGTYRLKVVYDADGLRAESNAVDFEILKRIKPSAGPDKLARQQTGAPPPTEKTHEK